MLVIVHDENNELFYLLVRCKPLESSQCAHFASSHLDKTSSHLVAMPAGK